MKEVRIMATILSVFAAVLVLGIWQEERGRDDLMGVDVDSVETESVDNER
jgi:hypothetical protein